MHREDGEMEDGERTEKAKKVEGDHERTTYTQHTRNEKQNVKQRKETTQGVPDALQGFFCTYRLVLSQRPQTQTTDRETGRPFVCVCVSSPPRLSTSLRPASPHAERRTRSARRLLLPRDRQHRQMPPRQRPNIRHGQLIPPPTPTLRLALQPTPAPRPRRRPARVQTVPAQRRTIAPRPAPLPPATAISPTPSIPTAAAAAHMMLIRGGTLALPSLRVVERVERARARARRPAAALEARGAHEVVRG